MGERKAAFSIQRGKPFIHHRCFIYPTFAYNPWIFDGRKSKNHPHRIGSRRHCRRRNDPSPGRRRSRLIRRIRFSPE